VALKEHRRVRTFVGVSDLSKEDPTPPGRLGSPGVFHQGGITPCVRCLCLKKRVDLASLGSLDMDHG
jgi:hypothetical protein